MANVGYVNKAVQAMYGIPYHELTAEQKKILHADSVRRAKLIEEREQAVIKNNLKAFEDEAKLEKVLASIYRDTQKQILADVAETMAKVKKAGGTWSYANQSALTRSRGLFEQITAELTKLGQKEQIAFTQGLSNIYTDQFLRQVYELGQTMTVKANFNRLNPALIKKTLDYPWSGAMFSDRIWLDKETLGRNLRVGLTQSMILGEGIPEITDRISRGIETSRYNAERLARTETKRVTYVAHNDAYEDMGVEELKYYTAGMKSSSTVCSICKADNGKIYKRGEEPTLPRHPNCKCVYIPVVSDTFKDNELNELTGSVRGAENYEKWINANKDKINPDGSLKDGWVRDWKNGGKLVNTKAPLNIPTKTDKDLLQVVNTSNIIPLQKSGIDDNIELGSSAVDTFDRKAKLTSIADDALAVNPNYSTGGIGYRMNCGYCSATYEMRRRGYNVEANPLNTMYVSDWLRLFNNTERIELNSKTIKSLKKELDYKLTSFGDGARGSIFVKWKGRRIGHFFSWEIKDDKLIWIDGQNGREGVDDYLDLISPNSVICVRWDNLTPSDKIQDACRNRR